MDKSLTNKLTRIDETLSIMKNNLELDENEVIENLAKATDMRDTINIFISQEEPVKKDGIWLQTEPFDFIDYTVDENMHIVGEIEGLEKWPKDTKSNQYVNCSTVDNTGYYLTYSTQIYFFPYNDYTTQEWYKSNYPMAAIYSYDGYLYLFGTDGKFSRVNINTKESQSLPQLPQYSSQRYYVAGVDRCLYFWIPGDSNQVNVFNIDTLEYSTMIGPKRYLKGSLSGSINGLPVWNGKIIVPHWTAGSGYSQYTTMLFDPKTGIWETAPSSTNIECASLVLIGTDLYMVSRSTAPRLYKHDLITNTRTLIELPFTADVGNDAMFNCNDQLVYYSSKSRRPITFASDTSSYDHDTIVIVQGQYHTTNYLITLYNLPKTGVGNFKWPMSDILPYINGKFKTGIPTYYGNGNEWIKFKN